jgi:hypothetical protein
MPPIRSGKIAPAPSAAEAALGAVLGAAPSPRIGAGADMKIPGAGAPGIYLLMVAGLLLRSQLATGLPTRKTFG